MTKNVFIALLSLCVFNEAHASNKNEDLKEMSLQLIYEKSVQENIQGPFKLIAENIQVSFKNDKSRLSKKIEPSNKLVFWEPSEMYSEFVLKYFTYRYENYDNTFHFSFIPIGGFFLETYPYSLHPNEFEIYNNGSEGTNNSFYQACFKSLLSECKNMISNKN